MYNICEIEGELMNNAIIFIRNEEEKQLSKTPYLGGNLLLHVVKEVRKVPDMKNV